MKNIKSLIKRLLTIIRHPLFSLWAQKNKVHNFIIGPHMTINTFSGLSIGENFILGRDSRFLIVKNYQNTSYDSSIIFGDNVTVCNRFTVLTAAKVFIGNDCLIASDVLITSENHGMNPTLSDNYGSLPLTCGDVIINKGCWIGEKVSILPNVELGERCIVATGAVVTKSFPPYSLIGGVPAKLLKTFDFEKNEWVSAT